MTTHAIYIDARRPEAQFSLRIMGYSASSVEISVLNGAALADLTGQGIALWYGPVPATGEPQLGHTVTGTVTASGCAVVDLALADTGYEGRLVAQVVSIVNGVSSVLGSGEIWMLANPARDTLPMTFDAPPWATADDIDAAISARVAGVEDLPDEPTYDQIIALLRAVLSALKGAAKIALAMLALGAGAQTSRLGSLRAGDVVVTNEQDALAYPVATNALALAEGALQADATNGMLTAESDPVAGSLASNAMLVASSHKLSTDNPHFTTAAQVGAVPGTAGTGGHSLGVDIYRGTDITRTTLTAGGVAVKASTGTTTFSKDGISKTASGGTWTINTTGASLAGSVPTPWSFAWADLIQRSEMVATNAAIYDAIEEKADIADIGKWSDIATNIVYHVVVSNGHWLIREVN